MDDKTVNRYSDVELEEFKKIVTDKLAKAREQLDYYLNQLKAMNDSEDAKLKGLDDGTTAQELERISTYALRQRKLIEHLEKALVRIHNKSYGVCRVTGKLISKERLKAVPHATLSIEAKNNMSR